MATRRNPGGRVVAMPRRSGNMAVVGAGRQVDLRRKELDGYRRKAQSKEWQRDALAYFSSMGVVKQSTYSLANTCSLVRLYVAWQPDPEQDPVAAPDGMVGVAEARDALERLAAGAKGGHPGIIHRGVVQLKVTGECWLVGLEGEPAKPPSADAPNGTPARPEEWLIASISELESKGEDYILKRTPGERQGRVLDREDDFTCRIWQEDAEFAEEADCALRGALGDCEEYLILSRAVRATGRSRIAGAGILIVPTEAEIGGQSNELDGDDNEGPEVDPADDPEAAAFSRRLLTAMSTAIAEEGDASAVVPVIVRIPGEHCDKLKTITFERPADTFADQRQRCIERLGMQLDIPLEEVIGITGGTGPVFMSGNTTAQMDQKLWNRYGRSTMHTFCESVSVGFLRPVIEAAGIDPAAADQLLVWFDPGNAIADPDPAETADEAFDRGAIGWPTYRQAKGFTEEDKPDSAELELRSALGLLKGAPSNQPADATTPAPSAQQSEAVRRAIAAAGERQPLGQRLLAIDRRLRTQLQEIADAALRRALERAGARVRNRTNRNRQLRDSVSMTAADEVPAKLGRSIVADVLGLSESDLLADQFDTMRASFDDRVSRAQRQTREALADELDLDDDELAQIERNQDRDRGEAWAWFAGAMASLAANRLYNPHPAAPPRGEADASALVPASMLREAMARAGGAVSGGHPDTPSGGVALGDLVRDVWAAHGRVVAGWEWVYGDPSTRTQPFEPHIDLDGVQFDSWDDQVLANDEGWPDAFFRPGDHDGCQCDFVPVGLDGGGE